MAGIIGEGEANFISLFIQASAIGLVALLSLSLTRSIRRVALTYWTSAWLCLAAALACLTVAFAFPRLAPLEWLYLLLEYAFGFMLIAGCRHHATGIGVARRDAWWLIPGGAVAAALYLLARGDFNAMFVPHSAGLGCLFVIAYRALAPARRAPGDAHGLRVVSIALVLLALDFFLYVPMFLVAGRPGFVLPAHYLQYASLFDLLFEVLLAFGTIIVVTGEVRSEIERTNAELRVAHDRLELLARSDPLTDCLNRHAFHALTGQRSNLDVHLRAGSVALIDIDRLKPINDSLGHAAGDLVIRAVARAIRSIIRADDLLFRWGGDEFLVLLPGVNDVEAQSRFAGFADLLRRTRVPGLPPTVVLSASWGISSFDSLGSLAFAIDAADEQMYRDKERRPSVESIA